MRPPVIPHPTAHCVFVYAESFCHGCRGPVVLDYKSADLFSELRQVYLQFNVQSITNKRAGAVITNTTSAEGRNDFVCYVLLRPLIPEFTAGRMDMFL